MTSREFEDYKAVITGGDGAWAAWLVEPLIKLFL